MSIFSRGRSGCGRWRPAHWLRIRLHATRFEAPRVVRVCLHEMGEAPVQVESSLHRGRSLALSFAIRALRRWSTGFRFRCRGSPPIIIASILLLVAGARLRIGTVAAAGRAARDAGGPRTQKGSARRPRESGRNREFEALIGVAARWDETGRSRWRHAGKPCGRSCSALLVSLLASQSSTCLAGVRTSPSSGRGSINDCSCGCG